MVLKDFLLFVYTILMHAFVFLYIYTFIHTVNFLYGRHRWGKILKYPEAVILAG